MWEFVNTSPELKMETEEEERRERERCLGGGRERERGSTRATEEVAASGNRQCFFLDRNAPDAIMAMPSFSGGAPIFN